MTQELRLLRTEAAMLQIVPALSAERVDEARKLFREYGLMRDVAPCVQDFERELASLPGVYALPDGRLYLLMAIEDAESAVGEPAGCVGLRRFDQDTCEMKRLYVQPSLRGQGAGRMLVEKLIDEARSIGYSRMVLDTLPTMQDAHKLYRKIGFREIPAYWKNPIPCVLYFELTLR
jgi:GNAT superfamily N-acetyltransferase